MEKEVRGSVLATILLCVLVLGKVGDAIGLAYIDSNPILVLVLNANDLHCALSTSRVNVWIYSVCKGKKANKNLRCKLKD